jgi:DNA-binding LytR/AlgR family response regulator
MEVNCIIIEDERPAIEILEHYISRVDFLKLKGVYQDPVNSMPMVNAEAVDLIFLDINLPEISGLDFIRNAKPSAGIILTTAHAEFAVTSFELEVVDYLLKPFSYDRFLKSVNRFLKLSKLSPVEQAPDLKKESGFIFLKSNKKMVKIFLDDILFIEAQKNYLLVVTKDHSLLCYQSISHMAERLPSDLFLRIHRSYIIAIRYVEQFTSSSVIIQKKLLPIGKSFVKDVALALEDGTKRGI